MSIILRKAESSDQTRIRRIVRKARLNPFRLDWPRFIVAEHDDIIVGVGQIKEHRDGSRELASIVVIPDYRGQGIARAIIEQLLAKEEGTVYLVCIKDLEGFYQRFGFHTVQAGELSRSMARTRRTGNFFARLISRFSNQEFQIIAMKRKGTGEGTSRV